MLLWHDNLINMDVFGGVLIMEIDVIADYGVNCVKIM